MSKKDLSLSLCVLLLGGCALALRGDVVEYERDGIPQGSYRIFVTSDQFSGDLGGRSGADQKCAASASAAGLKLEYLAVLGIDGAGSESRFSSAAAIYIMNDSATRVLVTSDKANFFKDSPGLSSAPKYDEFGRSSVQTTWTGGYGTSPAGKCLDWASSSAAQQGQHGSSGAKNAPATWILVGQVTCDELHPIYCMAYSPVLD
jgi:hypothetical protein